MHYALYYASSLANTDIGADTAMDGVAV